MTSRNSSSDSCTQASLESGAARAAPPRSATTFTRSDEFGRAMQIIGPKATWPEADFFDPFRLFPVSPFRPSQN